MTCKFPLIDLKICILFKIRINYEILVRGLIIS